MNITSTDLKKGSAYLVKALEDMSHAGVAQDEEFIAIFTGGLENRFVFASKSYNDSYNTTLDFIKVIEELVVPSEYKAFNKMTDNEPPFERYYKQHGIIPRTITSENSLKLP